MPFLELAMSQMVGSHLSNQRDESSKMVENGVQDYTAMLAVLNFVAGEYVGDQQVPAGSHVAIQCRTVFPDSSGGTKNLDVVPSIIGQLRSPESVVRRIHRSIARHQGGLVNRFLYRECELVPWL
jgi:hypothetical protein